MIFPIDTVVALLDKEVAGYQVPVVDLIAAQTNDPFKVLTATILSARTKDEVTAGAARRLFAQAENAEALAQLSVAELEELIYPVGFFRSKARYLAALPEVLRRDFAGQVPETIEELLRLPGVGRKTANLVMTVAFSKPAICVDTHVHRIMNIWGYVQTRSPAETETALRAKLPQQHWLRINSLLVAFGQGTCKPRAPHCDRCVIAAYCPQLGVQPRKTAGKEQLSCPVLRLVSWNVNGLRAVMDKDFLDSMSKLNADIIALQEIKALPEQLPEAARSIPGYQVWWHPAKKKGYSGVAVFSRKEPLRVRYGLGREEFDCEGRVLTLEFADFYLVAAYFPNTQDGLKRLAFKQAFNQAMLDHLNQLAVEKSVLLCGDLNVAHKEIDLANPKANVQNPGFSPEERAWMDELVQAGYLDTFRLFHAEPERYSWWSYRTVARQRNVGWRIDYFLVNERSRNRVRAAEIHDDIHGSDHCPVSIDFV
ncbi:exodeoxyribonuclease III [Desulfobulbus sp. F5]|nr:exodeoxyribonuclease III [Desulfobulbus sp. F5]